MPQCCERANARLKHLATREATSGPVLRNDRCIESRKSKLRLREILEHPQVSNVRPVKRQVQEKMNTFRQCEQDKWILDLRGMIATQIQRRLREQLIQDLKEGNDEAAFVSSQLGIDMLSRADQLELMIAAIPAVAKLVFEGTEAKSGLSMKDWREMHATHCTKDCFGQSDADHDATRIASKRKDSDTNVAARRNRVPGSSHQDFRYAVHDIRRTTPVCD